SSRVRFRRRFRGRGRTRNRSTRFPTFVSRLRLEGSLTVDRPLMVQSDTGFVPRTERKCVCARRSAAESDAQDLARTRGARRATRRRLRLALKALHSAPYNIRDIMRNFRWWAGLLWLWLGTR